MKSRVSIVAAAVIFLSLGVGGLRLIMGGEAVSRFDLGEITRGDLENTIACSGTIKPVGTVEIGTQVSGTIDRVYVDFNAPVSEGDVLAVLDTALLEASVLDAEAGVARAEAQLEQATADYERFAPLRERGLISEADFLAVELSVKTEKASLKSAQAVLERARRNLDYAVIKSPIEGTVVQRNVEAGQTVAASLSAPVLFIIAGDLSQMEIHAQVDESDIGRIEKGQRVSFTVQAYTDRTFSGTVVQIRLQPEVVQNVVNYTVVAEAANDEGLLLPGMTATVDFVVEEREDVLLVPNSALRFQPTEDMISEARKSGRLRAGTGARSSDGNTPPGASSEETSADESAVPEVSAGRTGEVASGFSETPAGNLTGEAGGVFTGGGRAGFAGEPPDDLGRVWYLDEGGQLRVEIVRTGATDGKMTEIALAQSLREGVRVVTGVSDSEDSEDSPRRNMALGMGPGRGRPF
jgi:HlyD family secretion protein